MPGICFGGASPFCISPAHSSQVPALDCIYGLATTFSCNLTYGATYNQAFSPWWRQVDHKIFQFNLKINSNLQQIWVHKCHHLYYLPFKYVIVGQACKLDILKKTQGEKTKNSRKKLNNTSQNSGFQNICICKIESRNSTFFHKNVIFNAYFLPDIIKTSHFCVKIKHFMLKWCFSDEDTYRLFTK